VRIVLLGPPGVGKGTQGRRLAAEYGGALISTGEILRDAVLRGTPLGVEARQQMDRGLLVADDVMIGLVRERTLELDARKAFVLDGFPRTVPQATALDEMLSERGYVLCAVVSLTAATDELVRRLSARRECPVCKRAYNAVSAPSKDGVHCDDHPDAVLIHRADDAEETIRRRLEVYAAQTAPLVEHYRLLRRLVEVDGMGEMNGVYSGLKQAIDAVRAAE
jgi:adenylate kinase